MVKYTLSGFTITTTGTSTKTFQREDLVMEFAASVDSIAFEGITIDTLFPFDSEFDFVGLDPLPGAAHIGDLDLMAPLTAESVYEDNYEELGYVDWSGGRTYFLIINHVNYAYEQDFENDGHFSRESVFVLGGVEFPEFSSLSEFEAFLNGATGIGSDTFGRAEFGQSIDLSGIPGVRIESGSAPDSIVGTDGADVLNGTSGADTMDGCDGPDELHGLAGDDRMQGGAGDDSLQGQAGHDILDGGAGIDTASYQSAAGDVSVYLNFGLSRGADGRDTLVNVENLRGSDFDDRLIGDGGSNSFLGGDGNDIIKGKGGDDLFSGENGDDRMRGADGVDTMNGDSGADILLGLSGDDVLRGSTGTDYIYGGRDSDLVEGGSDDDFLRGNLGNDTMHGGSGADDMRGGGHNDVLNGDAGDDFLLGEGGSDSLSGGAGNDTLFGGFGSGQFDSRQDTFIFASTADGSGGFDRIRDFEDGTDVIDLTAFGFSDFATEVATLASDAGSNMRLDFGNGDVLYIFDFSTAQFDVGDVMLA